MSWLSSAIKCSWRAGPTADRATQCWRRQMIFALRKTSGRTGRFLGRALTWRAPDRQHSAVAWGLVAGAIWLLTGLPEDPAWPEAALAGLYLGSVLAAICAIDARYGIIPDSLVAALAAGASSRPILAGRWSFWSGYLRGWQYLGPRPCFALPTAG